MPIDYHIHALAHGEYQYTREWINSFVNHACKQGITEIGFSEHDEFDTQVNIELFKKIQKARLNDINIKLGIEVDYIPGREDEIANIVSRKEYDYIIGSIHYIDGWGFDHPDFRDGFEDRDIDDIYENYTKLLIKMAQSGFFDVVGHLDLIKIWGHRPQKNKTLYYMKSVLEAIKKSGLVVEINSAGLRKPVAELYPAPDLIKAMYEKNIPITFGSDAHHPEQVGEGLENAYTAARRAGYKYQIRFNRHKIIPTSIEY